MFPFRYIKKGYSEYKTLSKEIHSKTGINLLGIRLDMLQCALLYGARPLDYWMFSFYKKSRWERRRYMTNYKWCKLLKICELSGGGLANAKDKEYELFSDCIRHNWFVLRSGEPLEKVEAFLNLHGSIIVKPIHGTLGKGVLKIDSISQLREFQTTINNEDYIVEECIQNNAQMSSLNPSSLNTIRAVTHIDDNGKAILDGIYLRVGVQGKVVDNWGAGGVAYYVDINTGIITKPGLDKKLNKYLYHPGTNVQMIGLKIEGINEIKDFALSLAYKHPNVKVVGWDIALTPKGLDFIELNCPGGHDLPQSFETPIWDVFKHIK